MNIKRFSVLLLMSFNKIHGDMQINWIENEMSCIDNYRRPSEMDLKLSTLKARVVSTFSSPEDCQYNFSLSRNLYPLCIHNPVRKE